MSNLLEELFICIDCESTGLDPKQDRIVEIALARFSFQKIHYSFETLINPQCAIPESSQKIHNISPEMVIGKPSIREVLPRVLELIQGHILIGHGIQFDLSLIASEAARVNLPTSILSMPFLDTLRLARLYGESPINSLEHLRKHFNIPAEGAHRAMSDVLVNIEVFKHLSKGFQTKEQMFQALQKPIKLKAMPLGKHKGRRFDEIPLEYLKWAERKDFDQDLLYSIRSELANRKRGGGFEQASNPFFTL